MKRVALILLTVILLTGCSSDQSETSSSEYDVWEESDSVSAAESEEQYVGSVNSDVYHYPSCRWAKEIYSENEIWFDSEDEAQLNGYRKCYVCM